MTFPLSPEMISEILGAPAPIVNVRVNWPILEAALLARSIYSDLAAVATIATVVTETGTFKPVKEGGGPTYLADMYEGRKDLGNTAVGDGVRFRGRGFVQISGRWDYTHFGKELAIDLVANPDLALDPHVAADILALYFHERGVPAYADAEKWEMVRRRVNGGMAGWPRFISAAQKLVAALKQIPQVAASTPEKSVIGETNG